MTMPEEITRKLREYAELLADANGRVRLTGSSDPDVLFDEHIMDALAALPYIEKFPSGASFVDVGTGGGLPGLVWAICRPDLSGVLLDSVGKKINMVAEIAGALRVFNITTVNARSEEYAMSKREFFDIATARAVSDSAMLVEYMSPLVRVGGGLLAFKGPGVKNELDVPPKGWKIFGLAEPEIKPYSVMGKELNLVIWEKISPCSRRFPRRSGEAKKNPWRGRG
ncbi:MAG: 16S rRNA (guanine(527)-N(7))-methyltransferase RsmG [Synergistaceae bacterium]|jgi:16S rRNA (guanine527-N7)-methyltransferase|nr:16S rRNA (guanine(527)-N(7))-methyltransferase RsmG [Synergistaceae bacterium]